MTIVPRWATNVYFNCVTGEVSEGLLVFEVTTSCHSLRYRKAISCEVARVPMACDG